MARFHRKSLDPRAGPSGGPYIRLRKERSFQPIAPRQHLSIQAWKPLTSVDPEPRRVRGAVPLGAAEEANPPNSLPLNVIPSLPAAAASLASRMGLRHNDPSFAA